VPEAPAAPLSKPQPARPGELFPKPQTPAPAEEPAGRPRDGAPRRGAERGAGWLSDLLARASRDEQEPPTQTPKQAPSLDSISLDITRIVDRTAATDAWDRYYRGDSHAFTRRICTLSGLQTFEDIRRRYDSDADFRDQVDRVIDEFERVLTTVAHDDRDGTKVRSYLVSDSGLFYTMLAQASGRLDPQSESA
jgi:hypothetical protein